ncbi:MAG: pyridoxal phosphate-dependent class II aminotransferase, partial [Tannerellaceae bacterium]|nr:pyridoxal phosphate-dependent class II aminotransferase [Tannerellaceae bacterium]
YGLGIIPTATTFFLVRLRKGTAADLKKYLEYGILIRDASNFRGLDDTYIRLSTQSSQENQVLVIAIKEWLDKRI